MTAPPSIAFESIARGESWKPIYQLQDSAAANLDLSSATVTVQLRIRSRAGTVTTRTKGVAGETSFPNGTGSDGKIQFLFEPAVTAALALGYYDLEIVYTDTGPTPDTKILHGRGSLEVQDPATGTI